MIPGARLVMLGRQGAGKGTQCTRLSRHFVVPHISTGDMLRAAVKEGTEFGRKAQEYMSAGELLPDDVIIGIVEERLLKDDTRQRGYILDGFPRTEEQAETLAEITAHQPLDMVVDLDVPTDVVLRRLASRRVCVDCGANYSVDTPPKHNWTCDHCGGEVIQRDDDTEDAIQRRLDLYEEETAPLVDWYRKRDLLMVVDGDGDADEVTARLVRAIESART
ncbi:adenylate kinase [Actinospongicola halichondriae]|uniref:adenylate kinase n=1 Tax=Actinospongicola halichondriae TaxID=3236844 RepID=UPI003D5A93E4